MMFKSPHLKGAVISNFRIRVPEISGNSRKTENRKTTFSGDRLTGTSNLDLSNTPLRSLAHALSNGVLLKSGFDDPGE